MADLEIAQQSASVVVRGLFNPAIFSPDWMLRNGVVGLEEFKAAEVQLISQELSQFKAGWLNCQVTTDSLTFQTQVVEEYERLRDAVVVTLGLLSHTPVAVLGINRDAHCVISTVDQWHAIGDLLAPKDMWPDLLFPGLRRLTLWAQRDDLNSGRIQVSVEPSLQFPRSVYIQHNDHFTLTKVDAPPTERGDFGWGLGEAEPAIEPSDRNVATVRDILGEEWAPSMKRADVTIAHVARIGAK